MKGTFSINTNVLYLFAILVASSAHAQEDRLTILPYPNDASRYVCDVKYATFITPKGWSPNRSGGNTFAILSRADEIQANMTQMISIDIGKPVNNDMKQLAEAFANKWNGKVAETALKMDGVESLRVIIPADKNKLQPVQCIVSIKDDRVFLLIAGGKNDENITQVMDDLVGSWKWK